MQVRSRYGIKQCPLNCIVFNSRPLFDCVAVPVCNVFYNHLFLCVITQAEAEMEKKGS